MAGARPPVRNLGALWSLLRDMRIEDPGACRTFERALAEENGWPLERAREVSFEYRRFLYLAALARHEVTPSTAVDAAWHLHLTYTRHYWDVLCREIIGRPLHHLPSAGGEAEQARLREQYRATLILYHETFGEPPPIPIWRRPAGEAGEPKGDRTAEPRSTASCGGGGGCGAVAIPAVDAASSDASPGCGTSCGGGGGCGS